MLTLLKDFLALVTISGFAVASLTWFDIAQKLA